jgi:ABC-type lipoprotein export system ATPase subunit
MRLELSNITVRLPGMAKPLFAIKKHEIASGARVLIQGPSGKGKTTLLHLMAGLVDPTEGTVALGDRNLGNMNESERACFRRENLGIIFQKLSLISHLTAKENIELALQGSELDRKIESAIGKVKIKEQADVLAQNLSLGQAQRVAVARVLAQAPKLVLADEPTSSLDDENADAVLRALFALSPETTIVVVSHDHRIREHFKDVRDFESLVRA